MKSLSSANPSGYIEMGVVGHPHGLRGEVTVRWDGESPIPAGQEIWIGSNAEKAVPYRVGGVRSNNGRPLLALVGIDDRTAAEALRNAKIFVPRASLPPPDEDEAWLQDLMGASIFLEDGTFVGHLDHVEYPAGQEIWAIKNNSGQEILFPARTEFIADIDVKSGKVRIAPPPGLLDIYLA